MQKRHHTIPQCYLRQFAAPDGKIWVLDKENKVFDTSPENIFVESHFYRITLQDGTKSVVVEEALASLEGSYAAIFENKLSKDLPLTSEERAAVAVFVAAMMLRTRPQRDSLRRMFEKMKESADEWRKQSKTLSKEQLETSAATPSGKGTSFSVEDLESGLEHFDEHHASGLLSQATHVAQYIFNMKWSIWKLNDAPLAYVTSDSPVVVERPAAVAKYGRGTFGSASGLAYKDTEVTLPLSKDRLLLAGWILEKDSYVEVSNDIAQHLIHRTIINATDWIVASSKEQLEDILRKYPPSA